MRHWYGVITDENNRYVANAAVKVYTAGAIETGSLAAGDLAVTGSFEDIYSDDGLTAIDQQGGDYLWSDSVGWAEFWADASTVVVALVFDGDVKRVITDVELDGSGGGGTIVLGGPISSGDLTMQSGYVLGRTSVGTGAIQELAPTGLLALSGGNASVPAASAAATSAGSSTTESVTPDGLAGSVFGRAVVTLLITDPNGDAITTGDGKAYYPVPAAMDGMNMIRARLILSDDSSSGSVTVQIHNLTQTADMLSGLITATSGNTSGTGTVDTANDDVATDDVLRVDVDSAGTDAKGLTVQMEFQLP